MSSAVEKFKGTLVGCAVGDALGAPVEGMDAAAIRESYGRVTDFIDERFGAGKVTDDTQLTVVLAQALIEMGRFDAEQAGAKFGRWITNADDGIKEARGVGAATGTATRRLAMGATPAESGVDSAGCGAAMRAGPIGLLYHHDPEALYEAAVEQALLTHTDPGAVAGSVAVAFAVAEGIQDRRTFDREAFTSRVADFTAPASPEMSQKLAGLAGYLDASPEEGYAYTGTGAVAIETVPGALFAFLRSPDNLEETLLCAVNAGGDTDSLGAIAGAVSGAFNGLEAIPARLREKLEGREYLESLGFRLLTLTPAFKPHRKLKV